MNIYYIERNHWVNDYDTTCAAVVIAKNEKEVRELMKEGLDNYTEAPEEWDPINSKCKFISKYTGKRVKSFILLTHFLHG